MAKKLKLWNGRGHGYVYGKYSLSVAAYSQKQAAELINQACNVKYVNTSEIRDFYSSCWGNSMQGIEPTEPCVMPN